MTSDDSSIEIIDNPNDLEISNKHYKSKENSFIQTHSFHEPKCFDQIEQHLLNESNSCPKILICGRQGVGKSTTTRYIANKIISKFKNQSDSLPTGGIIWLECDVGQPEFHPAGIMSLVHIPYAKYILSPSWLKSSSFLSNKDAYKILEAQYFGYNTPSHDPITYLKIVNNLYQVYSQKYSQNHILLINTNGWFKGNGMGLYLLGEMITIINPTMVIHLIREYTAGENLKMLKDPNMQEFVKNDSSFKTFHNGNHVFITNDNPDNSSVEEMPTFDYIIEKRSWVNDKTNTTKKSQKQCASTSRTLMLMSYFADILAPPQDTSSMKVQKECVFYAGCLLPCKPHAISFGQVNEISLLCAADYPAQSLAGVEFEYFGVSSILGKLVALCHLPTDQPPNPAHNSAIKISTQINLQHTCLGMGVVRNMDSKTRILYVLSPLPLTDCPKINYFVKGGIELPKEFLEIFMGQRLIRHKGESFQEEGHDATYVDKFDFLSHPVKTKRNDPKIGKRLRKMRNIKGDS